LNFITSLAFFSLYFTFFVIIACVWIVEGIVQVCNNSAFRISSCEWCEVSNISKKYENNINFYYFRLVEFYFDDN
jgi:hypothetical protein